MNPLSLRIVAALTVASLLYARQVGGFRAPRNRFYMFWDSRDSAALLVGLLLTAALAVAAREVLARVSRPFVVRAFDHVFVLALASVLLTMVPVPDGYQVFGYIAFTGIVFIIGVSFGSGSRWAVSGAKIVSLAMSPFVLLLVLQVLRFETSSTATGAAGAVPPEPRSSAPALAWIVFDGWSYPRSLEDGALRAELPNLRSLARRSISFEQARSRYSYTAGSLPAIIYQADLKLENQDPYWDWDEPPKPDLPSIFAAARERGYVTRLVGYYVPYCAVLGEELDTCFAASHVPKGETFGGSLGLMALRNLRFFRDPVMPEVHEQLNRRAYSRHWFALNQRIIGEALRVLGEARPGTLTFVHLAVPHWPFVFNPDGSYYGHDDGDADERGPAGEASYLRSLMFADRVLGAMLERLEASGQLDRMTLIVASDHAARTMGWSDPDLLRVPLVVRLPGQQTAVAVGTPFQLDQLSPLIEAALDGPVSQTEALELLNVDPR